jgi:hypothetical protein
MTYRSGSCSISKYKQISRFDRNKDFPSVVFHFAHSYAQLSVSPVRTKAYFYYQTIGRTDEIESFIQYVVVAGTVEHSDAVSAQRDTAGA